MPAAAQNSFRPEEKMSEKKNKPIILPDGTEISQEELDKMDDRHSWGKKAVLGQRRK